MGFFSDIPSDVWPDLGMEYIKKINDLLLIEPRERLFQEYIITRFLQRILPKFDIVPVDDKVSGDVHDYSKYCGKYGPTIKEKKREVNSPCIQHPNSCVKTPDPCIQTPDLCVAKGWKWINNDGKTEYIATVEIKSPSLIIKKKKSWIAPGYEEVEDDKGGKNLNIIFENKVKDITEGINNSMLRRENGEYIYKEDKKTNLGIIRQVGIHLRGINKVIATDGVRWIFFYKNTDGKCEYLPTIDLGKRIFKKIDNEYEFDRIEWDIVEYVVKGRKEPVSPYFSSLIKQIQEFCTKDVSQFKKKRRLNINVKQKSSK